MEAALNGPSGRIVLGPAEITVGRLSSNQLMVSDPKASSRHATISPAGQGYRITDLGSTNGTFVNEQRLSPNTPLTLNPGDRIRIGDTTFTYEVAGAMPFTPTVYGSPGQGQGYDPTVAAASPYSQYEASPPPAYQPPEYQVPPAQPAYQAPPPAYSPYGSPAQPAYGVPGPGIAGAGFPPAQQSRRTLWIVLGIVGGVVIIGIIALFAVVVANPSSPTKTLQAYCDAIKGRDYQTAYNQFSSNVQNQVSESQFATLEDNGIKPLKGVSSCSVDNVSQGDTTATGTITYTFGNGQSGPLPYSLIKEGNTWKISREGNGS